MHEKPRQKNQTFERACASKEFDIIRSAGNLSGRNFTFTEENMKKIFYTLVATSMLLVSFVTISAQGKKMSALQEVLGQLNLSAEQQSKVEPVAAKHAAALKALKAETTITEDERKVKNQEIQKTTNAELKEILTKDQMLKLRELRKGRSPKPAAEQAAKP